VQECGRLIEMSYERSTKYMDRVFTQKERLKKQRERIEAQQRTSGGVAQRHIIEMGRLQAQDERIRCQNMKAYRRAEESKIRGQAISGVDALERKKLSRQRGWKGKWALRRAKFEARVKKYRDM